MDFNTLDAQHEACEAYITSQRAEGWQAIKTRYEDGGFSGGNMDRPALQRLLSDIQDGKVDIVVVYKIDRLTRSLMDFSKLVEIFDKHEVTFVSVTQSFNTTTSMGRLTLNMLLSFAQFEREVSAERIRDKVAASKKKGMWMGGNPPVGYEVNNRQLTIHEEGAKLARYIFDRYLALGCVARLKQELDSQCVYSLQRLSQRGKPVGGKPFSRGALYSILQNPIYIGKIRHKDALYDGQHERIIPQDIWNAVQERLTNQAAAQRGHHKHSNSNLLKGLLFDKEGTLYTPMHTKKSDGKSYRYYVSQNLIQCRDHPQGILARIPAHEIEQTVTDTLHRYFTTPSMLAELLMLDRECDHDLIMHIIRHCPSPDLLIQICIPRITIERDTVAIVIDYTALREHLGKTLRVTLPISQSSEPCVITAGFTPQRSYKGAIILKPEGTPKDSLDLPPVQLKNLVRGIVWRDRHFSGESIRDIARQENLSEAGVRKIIMGSFDALMAI